MCYVMHLLLLNICCGTTRFTVLLWWYRASCDTDKAKTTEVIAEDESADCDNEDASSTRSSHVELRLVQHGFCLDIYI
jgi:hypothetical protein